MPHEGARGAGGVPVKILHVRSSGGYYGAEALIEGLARAQQQAGDAVIVAGLVDRRWPHTELIDRLEGRGVEVARLESGGRFDARLIGQLAKLARAVGAEIIHTHDYKTALVGLAAAWAVGAPAVATFHGEVSDTARVRAYEALARGVLRLYGGVALVSRAQASAFGDPFRRARPVFIPNGIDVDGFVVLIDGLRQDGSREAWRRRLGIEPDAVVIATVGRLCSAKGQVAASGEVFALLARRPSAVWVLAGEGEDKEAVEVAAAEAGVGSQVRLLGHVGDMASLYAGIDVLLHPSEREGLPMVILEAMAAGLAIASSPVGEIPRVLEGDVGVLLQDREAGMGRALEALVDDGARRAAMGELGRRRAAERYSVGRLAAQVREGLYDPALGRR